MKDERGAQLRVGQSRYLSDPYNGAMTSWGNTRQRAAAYSAVALFTLAILMASTSIPGWALLPMMLGLICTAGVWALGLPKRTSPDEAEWHTAIK